MRAFVLSINTADKRASLSLKPSLTSTKDALFLESYFHEKALLSGPAQVSWLFYAHTSASTTNV